MSKLSFDALKERAEVTASTELLASITGGVENACHDTPKKKNDDGFYPIYGPWW
jgi:hypothetical protein